MVGGGGWRLAGSRRRCARLAAFKLAVVGLRRCARLSVLNVAVVILSEAKDLLSRYCN